MKHWEVDPNNGLFVLVDGSSNGYSYDPDTEKTSYIKPTLQIITVNNTPVLTPNIKYSPVFSNNYSLEELGKAANWYTGTDGNYYRKTRRGKYKLLKNGERKFKKKSKELLAIDEWKQRLLYL